MTLEFELPFPPSANHIWRRVGNRTLLSREGRRFRATVVAILSTHGIKPLTGRLEVVVEVFPPDRRRRDLDNLQKSLIDAMQHGGVYLDDGQIDRLIIERRAPVAGGKTRVRVRCIDD